ncbi:hypothetical protein RINTHH_16390 [Richelia intracellularis HH01]|uniref:Uncharacterized protein n=1 Tax=Richelia intracellularis HH01 TaxID=1165094 RepID=M1WT48_9NOST|nr:hypothetical protein RINTHH_16390 [Richelia intracellularis HH01]
MSLILCNLWQNTKRFARCQLLQIINSLIVTILQLLKS